jgi:hypothetical protein
MLDNKGHKPEHNVEQKSGQAPSSGDAALAKFPTEVIGERTLWAITQQYNITLKALYQANKDQFQAIVEDPKGTVFPPTYYKDQIIRIPDTASVPALELQFNLEHEHKGRGAYARKGDKPVADKGKEPSAEDRATKIVQDLAAVEKERREAAHKAADEQKRQAAEKVEAAHKASAIGEVRRELKYQQDIDRQLNQDYVHELKKNSGGLGITAETVQTTLGASASSKNPVEAFLGQHLINKDLNLDATEKIIDTTMADSVQKINQVQRDLHHLEQTKSSNWHTELNQTRKTIYQLMANAETIKQAIGNFAEAKTGTKDAIADGVAITGGVVATAVPVPGFNLAVGAGLKTAIKGGDALSTGSEYTWKDGVTDGATGALDAFAVGKGLQAGNAASKMAMKAGLSKAGFNLAGKGLAQHFVAEETASAGKKVLATAATVLIKDGITGSGTVFVRSTVSHTAGVISDLSRGKNPELGKRAGDIGLSTVSAYGTSALLGLGSRVTGEGFRLGADNTTRVVKNVSARLYKPTETLSTAGSGTASDLSGLKTGGDANNVTPAGDTAEQPTVGADKGIGATGADKTSGTTGTDKTGGIAGTDKTAQAQGGGENNSTNSGSDKAVVPHKDDQKGTVDLEQQELERQFAPFSSAKNKAVAEVNSGEKFDLSNATDAQRTRYEHFLNAAKESGIKKIFSSVRYNGDIEIKYGKGGTINTTVINKQGGLEIEQYGLGKGAPSVKYAKIDANNKRIIGRSTLDESGKRVAETTKTPPPSEGKLENK